MPSLIRIHGGTALCVLILGSTPVLFSQNVQHQETNGGHPVAAVQPGAHSPRSDADPAQQSRSKPGAPLDNSAATAAGSQNTEPQSVGQQPNIPLSPRSSTQTAGEEAPRQLQRAQGTAVAPAPAVLPIAAAEPTGIAIAPAKQRRVRKIVLKVGALVGASAALSTVLILSKNTPSKPAVAH
jgi:hypothetical protein